MRQPNEEREVLVLDKSALEGLSFCRCQCLAKRYDLNVTPILVNEILGDLVKPMKKKQPKTHCRKLVEKIQLFKYVVNVWKGEIAKYSLLGIKTMEPYKAVLDDESPSTNVAIEILSKIGLEDTGSDDAKESATWRESTRNFGIESLKKEIAGLAENLPCPSTVDEILGGIRAYLSRLTTTKETLTWIFRSLSLSLENQTHIIERWKSLSCCSLMELSWYACYYMEICFYYRLALNAGLISTKSTHRIDLEYLFYLPFCTAFLTGDKTQYESAKVFERPCQHIKLISL